MKKILILLLLTAIQNYSQIRLERITPYFNPSKTAHGIKFFTEQKGVIFGAGGMAYLTSDGGLNWQDISVPTNSYISDLYLVNNSTIFAIANYYPDQRQLFKTTDGGLNWKEYLFPHNYRIANISFLNNNIGFAVGEFASLFKTTNGGESWNLLKYDSSSSKTNTKVQFIDELHGWIREESDILKTTDGGETWEVIYSNSHLFEWAFINKDIGYNSGYYGLKKTTDGGVTWELVNMHSTSLKRLIVFDENTIIAVNFGYDYYDIGNVVKSTNGGVSFSKIYEHEIFKLYGLSFLTPDKGFVLVNPNCIIKTTDGEHFEELNGFRSASISSPADNIVILSERNYLLKSYDKGLSWRKITTNVEQEISYIFFIDSLIGFLSAKNNPNDIHSKLFRTTDGGYSWSPVLPEDFINITRIQFVNNQIGWIHSNYYRSATNEKFSALYKTTNRGIEWELIKYSPGKHDEEYFFLNENIGWYKSKPDGFFKSLDGGISWIKVSNKLPGNFTFFSEDEGIYIDSKLYKSFDGGLDWTSTPAYYSMGDYYSDYKILDMNTALISAVEHNTGAFPLPHSVILEWTTDGGNTLNKSYLKKTGGAQFSFIDNNNGWFLTGREIYKISVESTTDVKHLIIPSEYALSQNYPNPFNPSTKLKYSLPVSGPAKIIVYDLLGKELTTLINNHLEAGEYEIEWNAASHPSGIYFYKLQTNDITITRKMLLLK
jgi:photosystem II stability/assembly factor-like uncharacterized protein